MNFSGKKVTIKQIAKKISSGPPKKSGMNQLYALLKIFSESLPAIEINANIKLEKA